MNGIYVDKDKIMTERENNMSEAVTKRVIDELDIAIIRELKENSQRSAAEIARILEANERTVRRRIDKLVESAVIRYSIVVNPLAFGYISAVDIFLQIDPQKEEAAIECFLNTPEIFYVARGQDDNSVSIQARFKDNDAMFNYLYKILPEVPGVTVKGFALIPRIIKTVDSWMPNLDEQGVK